VKHFPRKHHTPPALLTRLGDAASDVFPKYFAPDCCLNSTRVLVEVAKQVGLPHPKPMQVIASVGNAAALRLLDSEGLTPEIWKEQRAKLVICGDADAEGDGWPGHLCLVVGRHWLVDGSSRQLSRLEYDIDVPEIVGTRLQPDHLSGKRVLSLGLPMGAVLFYQLCPELNEYADTPGFQFHYGNQQVAAALLSRFKEVA